MVLVTLQTKNQGYNEIITTQQPAPGNGPARLSCSAKPDEVLLVGATGEGGAQTVCVWAGNKEMTMKQLLVSDKAREHEFVFQDMGLFHRSEQKFSEGLRTTKRDLPYRNWCELRRSFGESFLISCYCGGTYCVVTTPTEQYGLLTEELQEGQTLVNLHARKANRFLTDINLMTGEIKHTTGPKLNEESDLGPPPVPPGEATDGQHRTSSD